MVIKAKREKLNQKEVKKIVSLFKEKLKQEKIPFEKVMLFGSYASDQAHIDSDIDVAVVLPANVSEFVKKELSNITWWAKQINVKLEAHILSSTDFQNKFFSLPALIKKNGILV
ncbi:nucleotidyltransferase domain-containing protein [Candidatus Gribaldobacteria bacterium]|nr:nucleotidyltransferase domain-containing protein [Candidatus Gribaldobacteria bacterium]